MTRTDWDVIVAGAGAGGAAAALYLVRDGLRVLVVEKARLPRYKACGGAIPRPVLDRLPPSVGRAVRARPTGVRFTFPGQVPVDVPLPDGPVAMVMRREFDALLLSSSEADVLDGTPITGVEESVDLVRVQVGDRSLTARYLVGADGATSLVARGVGLRRHQPLGGALEAELPLAGEGACLAQFALGAVSGGYAWVFPKGDSVSVGIARFRPGRADLSTALRRAMHGMGIDLAGATLHGHPIPAYQPPPWPFWGTRLQGKICTRRCVLVGDAAGLVDPLLGEGIRYAVVSARLAAQAVAADDLTGYGPAVWREMGHSLATASLVAGLFYRWPRQCFQLGVRNRAIIRLWVDLLTEKASYQGVGRRLLATTARWMAARPAGRAA